MPSLLSLKPNIGAYTVTDPQYNMWIDGVPPFVADIQSGGALRHVLAAMERANLGDAALGRLVLATSLCTRGRRESARHHRPRRWAFRVR